MHYFFDSRLDERFIPDANGLEFDDFDAVKWEAVRALTEAGKDLLPSTVRRKLSIEVSDEEGRTVLITAIVFEALVPVAV
jgi:hypothetical protein